MILKTTETPSFYTPLTFTCGNTGTHLGTENSAYAGQLVLGPESLRGGTRYCQESNQENLIFSGKAKNIESAVFCESGGEEGIGWGEGKGTAENSEEWLEDQGYYLALN